MTQGNCVGSDPDQFHATHQELLRKAARTVCSACPVIDKCLQYALARMDDGEEDGPDREIGIGKYGVWGGTLPIDRWRILNRRPSHTERHAA